MGLFDRIRKGLGFGGNQDEEETATPGVPPFRIAAAILQTAIKDGASEIRIEPSLSASPVDFIIDGKPVEMMTVPPNIKEPLLDYFKGTSGILIQSGVEQSGEMQFRYNEQDYKIEVEFMPQDGGDLLVLTFAQPNTEEPIIEQLMAEQPGFDGE